VAGAVALVSAINDFLGLINMARDAARGRIAAGDAELAFWEWLGAKPTRGVWDDWHGALPPDTEPSSSVWSSSSFRYVADIDVGALRQNLSARIHDYQDFLYFMDAARELGQIEEDPPPVEHPNAAQRAQAGRARYYTTVSRIDHGKRHRYDLTDIVAPVRDAALADLDASKHRQFAALGTDQRGRTFRLRRGAETPLYRAAHRGDRLEQRILDSQLLLGPDPWVRLLGPELDVGGWFSTDIRVFVTPANADAERVALASSYWFGGDIYDAFEEVTTAGRPILSREPREGRIINSFVAGPLPGSRRFGNTRYYQHPDPSVGRTAAIGELNEFWVARDDLVPIPTAEVEGYASALPPAH
jgi:hypothetical protein